MAARPLTVKLGVGQCTFSYMPQEEAEKYAEALKALHLSDNKEAVEANEYAFGLHHNLTTKKYELITIRFNSLTKAVVFDKIEEVSERKNWAVVALQNAQMKKGII